MVRPSHRREMAKKAAETKGVSIELACRAFKISESCYRYERKLNEENKKIEDWLLRLTDNNRNWDFGLCYLYLRNVKGFKLNLKDIYRIYKELELNLRIKPRKRLSREKPEALSVPEAINQVRSMDFMHDQLETGKSFRLLNVISWRGRPKVIRCDNGPEYISSALQTWAESKHIKIEYIQRGNPQQNAYVERFNRTVRYEWLSQYYWKD